MSDETKSGKQRQREQSAARIREARTWLRHRFPAVFGGKGGVPMAVGAHQQAHDAATNDPDAPPHWAIQTAIRKWARHPRYLEGVVAKRTRRHLDGTESEAVTDEQAEHARKQLAELKRKRKQQRKRQEKEGSEGAEPGFSAQKPSGRPVLKLKQRRQRRQENGG